MKDKNERLIVVLGMHRSGTSAITRGLQVLGVDLGDRLLSAADGDNDKGYWEDIDVNKLNIEMLHALGKDWYHTSPIDQIDLNTLDKKGYFLKAGKLLNEKLKGKKLFGLKDPRIAKLLPFWKDVFARCDIDVSYVIAVRHPLSVVKSLEQRGWESRERNYLLWLNHVISSLSLTDSQSSVLVDYDHLLRDSANELARMANSLNLSIDDKALADYQTNFLDTSLQHSEYQPNDSGLDPSCPALAAEIYLKLQDVISENECGDDETFQGLVTQWAEEFNRLGPILNHVDQAITESMQTAHQLALKASEIVDLSRRNLELDSLVKQFRDEKIESDNDRMKLKESVIEREEQITGNRRQLIEYDGLVNKLKGDLEANQKQFIEHDGLVQKLNGDIEEKQNQLIEYDGLVQKLNGDMEEQQNQLIEYDGLVQKLNGDIEEQQNQLIEYDGLVRKLNGDIEEQQNQLIEYDGVVQKLNEDIEAHKRSNSRLAQEITENRQKRIEQDAIVQQLNDDLTIAHQTAESHNEILKHREHEATDLTQALLTLEQLKNSLTQETEVLRSQLRETYRSTSWRITTPIRIIKNACTNLLPSIFAQEEKMKGFDANWYLAKNPDVKISGHDPLEHYLEYGQAEGRAPRPASFFPRNRNRLQILTSLASQIIEETGGVIPAFKKAAGAIQQDGWDGIKARILHSHTERENQSIDNLDYSKWVSKYDTLTTESRSRLTEKIKTFSHQPLISVVMPVYNANPVWLAEAIESVRTQIYPNWELCIADDASTDDSIRPILEQYAAKDARIKVVIREQNGHISATSNSAIEMAEGEWIALLDHDDLLSEHALFWIAECINTHQSAQMIYSDEDKIDEEGTRSSPYFKCDWNVDLFYSHNMFSHLGAYKADLVQSVGGFRLGIEGSQDYDLALRCIEKIDQSDIRHIPRVLYHWRIHEESTASSSDAKPYAMIAGERAINEHFERTGVHASAELFGHGYRVKYALPADLPLVSLVIPTRDNLFLLKQCVDSLLNKTSYANYEIVIVDNGSTEPDALEYLDKIQQNPVIQVIRDDSPFNFSALNNLAVSQTNGEIVGLINNDIEVISEDWLSEMVSLALQKHVGAVGARLWYPDDTIQHAGIVLGLGEARVAGHPHIHIPRSNFGYFGRAMLMQSFSAVTAACLLIKKDIYNEVDGLNENELGVGFNDVDFCLRVKAAGYKNLWTPYAELYHHESASRGYEDDAEKRDRFNKEVEYMQNCWGDLLLSDPAYSPNLTLDHSNFSYAWPPRVDLIM